MLTNESITFGKYKGGNLYSVLRDRNYCSWLIEQEWFQNNYGYLYNRIKEYKPSSFFIPVPNQHNNTENLNFMENYVYFNLRRMNELEIELNIVDRTCYEFYLKLIDQIKQQIYDRMENDDDNVYDIKAPNSWLQIFEKKTGIQRSDFKDFLNAYELPNITSIIETIKKEGGIEYKGAKSFLIAKERSLEQEKWWENILKEKYGEDISSQFKYEKCIFDFLNIKTKTIFECKLGLKDFDEVQHQKYKIALKEYRIIYLIAKDCVINIQKSIIYTTNPNKYQKYLNNINMLKQSSYLDELITIFDIIKVEKLCNIFN